MLGRLFKLQSSYFKIPKSNYSFYSKFNMVAEITCFFDKGGSNTAQYVIADTKAKQCAVLDSVLNFDSANARTSTEHVDEIVKFIKEKGYTNQFLLETHAHADHLSAAPVLKEQIGGKIGIGEHITTTQETFKPIYNLTDLKTDGSQFDVLFKDGDTFNIGELEIQVLHTPGHTLDSITYYIPSDCVFVGDTLFMPEAGSARCDFPNGNAAKLYHSIQKILSLPSETRLFCCHDYGPGGREVAWETTVGQQKQNNIHFKDTTEEDYVKLRESKDATLAFPRLLIPSIQNNIRAGNLPTPEDNGVSYLKIPLNKL